MAEPLPPVRLSPSLDSDGAVAALQAEFQRSGRLHVPGVLDEAAARRLHRCLAAEIPWQTVFRARNAQGDRHVDLHQAQIAALDRTRQHLLGDSVYAQARDQFTYVYNNYPIADAFADGKNPGLYVNDLFRFLNSEPFLSFARRVTGIAEIARADAQATLYRSGHLLTRHDDVLPEQQRLAAYVLSLTPEWRADWGGLLLFLGEQGHVEEGYEPRFNALNLFRVGQPHAVSYVTPFAGAGRYSVTGWLRAA
jgi:SM-20-related protein